MFFFSLDLFSVSCTFYLIYFYVYCSLLLAAPSPLNRINVCICEFGYLSVNKVKKLTKSTVEKRIITLNIHIHCVEQPKHSSFHATRTRARQSWKTLNEIKKWQIDYVCIWISLCKTKPAIIIDISVDSIRGFLFRSIHF